jgi:predicted kinase
MDISDVIVPIPGATRVNTVASIARAGHIVLTDADRADLDRRMPSAAASQRPARAPVPPARATRTDGDVVIVMGMPAAGKSTVAMRMVGEGYARLNRDVAGGTLRGLLPALDRAIDAGDTRVVLDNTYASRRSRAEVIRAAAAHHLPVQCVWLSTSLEDAQTNAAWRIVSRYGRLPADEELARLRKTDVSAFLPSAQFKYRRDFEPPEESEGFWRVDVQPFVRHHEPHFINRAVIVSCDDGDDLARLAGTLRGYQDAGYRLLGISWQPEIGEGKRSQGDVTEAFARQAGGLGLDIDVQFCPHPAGPPKCWCRKPLPGLGVLFVSRYELDPAQCIYLGSGPHDAGFARRVGFRFESNT